MKPKDLSHKTIIIAPLDWGMGHLTRSLALIQQLIKKQNKIVFAGTAFQCDWIQKEVEGIIVEEITGFNIQLDSSKSTYFQMLAQTAKMRKVFQQEKNEANVLVNKHQADVIVSDNRYGFRSKSVTSILMTHQLSPPIPRLRSLVTKSIVSWVNKFDACWIVDNKENPLCEDLNSPNLKVPKHYIGWLSRFKKKSEDQHLDIIFIASGPEPQMSSFTKMVNNILVKTDLETRLVVPYDMGLKNQVVNPSTTELNDLINQTRMVVSRAGYTTLMELASISKQCILVPTPGQFEQEYLTENVKIEKVSFIVESSIDQYFTSFID